MARRASARRRGPNRLRHCRARRRGHAHASIRPAAAERQPRRDDTVRGGAGGACGQSWRRRQQRRRRRRRRRRRGRGDGGRRGWRVALRELDGDVCAHACAGGAGCARETQGANRARRRRAHNHGGRSHGRQRWRRRWVGRRRPVGGADADIAAVCGAAGAALAAATGVDFPQRLRRLPQASRRQLECHR